MKPEQCTLGASGGLALTREAEFGGTWSFYIVKDSPAGKNETMHFARVPGLACWGEYFEECSCTVADLWERFCKEISFLTEKEPHEELVLDLLVFNIYTQVLHTICSTVHGVCNKG